MIIEFKNENELKKYIFTIIYYYKKMIYLLDIYFLTGYHIYPDDELNRIYLLICLRIEELIKLSSIDPKIEWKPFNNILSFDPDAPEAEWEYGKKDFLNILSDFEELNLKYGNYVQTLSLKDEQTLSQITDYVEKYKSYKNKSDFIWAKKIEEKFAKHKENNLKADNIKIKKYVFLSYANKDIEIVENICKYLENSGLKCWYAKRDIPKGNSWIEEIPKIINQSIVLVLVLTKESNNSEEVLKEIRIAEKLTHIIPFKIGNFPLSEKIDYRIGDLQTIQIDYPLKTDDLQILLNSINDIIGRRD